MISPANMGQQQMPSVGPVPLGAASAPSINPAMAGTDPQGGLLGFLRANPWLGKILGVLGSGGLGMLLQNILNKGQGGITMPNPGQSLSSGGPPAAPTGSPAGFSPHMGIGQPGNLTSALRAPVTPNPHPASSRFLF